MRFSIRSLLLVFPAYFLALVGQDWLECGRPMIDHRFRQAQIEATNYADQIPDTLAMIEVLEQRRDRPASERTVDACMGVVFDEYDSWLNAHGPAVDPWGHAYICVLKDNPTDPRWPKIGVYSLGRDGESATEGMDPDDLNSWDANTGQLYLDEGITQERVGQAWFALFLTPFVYLGLVVCGWLLPLVLMIRSAVRRPRPRPMQELTHEKTPDDSSGVS